MVATLKIRDFQSIGETELKVDGFTVITGPNNAGKSSVVRAIQGMFTNHSGPKHGWVRNGTSNLSVALTFGGGDSILWERGPKVSRYVVNGTPLEKVGREVPSEVKEFGIRSFKIGKETLWPQIANQFLGTTFLTKESGSVLAEAIADVDRVGKLNRALRLGDSKRRDAASQLKVRRKDADALSGQLHALEGLDSVQDQAVALELARVKALDCAQEVEQLTQLQAQLASVEAALSKLEGVEDIQLTNPAKAQKCQGLLDQVRVLRTRLRKAETTHLLYRDLGEISLPSKAKAQKASSMLEELRGLQRKLRAIKKTLSTLPSEFPDLGGDGWEEAEVLSAELGSLVRLKATLDEKTKAAGLTEGSLDEAGDLLDKCVQQQWTEASHLAWKVDLIVGLRASLALKQQFLDETTEVLAAKESELAALVHETHDTLAALENCPTCGSVI